jgi:hypothetical protein
VSADPCGPCTVEKRTKTGVCADGSVRKPAVVYSASDSYTWK